MTGPDEWIDHVPTVIADPDIGARVYRIPPGDLALGLNARREIPDDPEFAASIRELGVLEPIVAYIAGPRLQVLIGQRRAYFAHQVGRAWVPVVLVHPPGDAARVVEQLVENHHRTPITTADDAAALAQLQLYGLTVDEIARRTARPRRDVDAAVKVAASPAALAAAAAAPVDLEQAGAIAELGAAEPSAVEQLVAAAEQGRGAFDHVRQQLVDARRDREEQAAVLDAIRATGVVALETVDWTKTSPLDALHITPAKHRKCPGHAAFAQQRRTIDGGRWTYAWVAAYVCTEPKRHRPEPAAAATLDDEAARARRAEVLEGNRQWRAAETVRRRWLGEFARRTVAPANASTFIALALLRGDECVRKSLDSRHRLLRELLAPDGGDVDELEQLVERADRMPIPRVRVLTAAALLAAWEATADVHCWRDANAAPDAAPWSAAAHKLGGWRGVDRFYLRWYRELGYEPSPIEQRVIDAPDDEPADASAEVQS